MHYLMFATLNRPKGAGSQDTRERVRSLLLNDDSFCGEGGRFGSPLCDWFVIGGRWSGYLNEAFLGQEYLAALQQEFPKLAFGSFPAELVEQHRQDIDQLWLRFGRSGRHPLNRSNYDELGSGDDAMRIDQALYDKFLCEFEGEAGHWDRHCTWVDLDDEPADRTFIGRKWLVVVDYHS